MSKYCADLTHCKRLVELGVALETEKYWVMGELVNKSKIDNSYLGEIIPAPCVGQLGEVFPASIMPFETIAECRLFVKKLLSGAWSIKYKIKEYHSSHWKAYKTVRANTEANARILMLIKLIEQRIVKVEDINEKTA